MEIMLILQEIGLSEKEAIVYIALLKLGEETASRVSQVAELNRITTYALLKSLKEKGFCSIYDKNNVQYFKAIKPEQILGLLDERKNKIKVILPELKGYESKVSAKPEISLFEGKKGITAMLYLILKDAQNKKEVFGYGNLTVAEKVMEYQSLHWRKIRLQKKIKMKGVVDSFVDIGFVNDQTWRGLTQRRTNKDLAKINTYVLFTENLVAYLSLSVELVGVLIKNKEIAGKERFNFDMLWGSSK